MRYYVHPLGSWCYDDAGLSFPKRVVLSVKDIVTSAGATRLRWAHLNGYLNLPKVLCFEAPDQRVVARALSAALRNLPADASWALIVCAHWRQPKERPSP